MIERLWRQLRNGNVPDTRAVVRELHRQYYALRSQSGYNDTGIDVFAEDWDNLIILDACRYDAFAARSEISGELQSRHSRGAMTQEWLRANFAGKDLTDTVYISANGQFAHLDGLDAALHSFIGVWREEFEVGERDATSLAPPEIVTERVLKATEEYPDKRLLVHYVQPHLPYIGPTGQSHIDPKLAPQEFPGEIRVNPMVSQKTIKKAYVENLDIVLEEVEKLLDSLPGKTVVSADHGELLGERLVPFRLSEYGHPKGVYHKKLIEVPWLTYTNGERKNIVAEDPKHDDKQFNDHNVEQHLEDLGYVM